MSDELIGDFERRIRNLEADNRLMLEAFRHAHVAGPDPNSDRCQQCGLDLRHQIHTRLEPCDWRQQRGADETVWHTDCGTVQRIEEGGPKENGIHFCPSCGRIVAGIPWWEDEGE